MLVLDFKDIASRGALAKALGCETDLLVSIPRSALQEHRIPKRSGGFREAWEITSAAHREALKTLGVRLEAFTENTLASFPRPSVHGFVKNHSIVTNARVHAGRKLLLKADIRSFFPTIRRDRVARAFLDLGMQHAVASCVADFVTLDGSLPLGFPTSPLIANIIAHEMDGEFDGLASAKNAQYTRYADDLTFSSDTALPERSEIEDILQNFGFQLHPRKFCTKKNGQAVFVTGLSVSDRIPRVPRHWKKRLAQEVYYAERYGLREHIGRAKYSSFQSGINKISGRLQFLRSVEPGLAAKLEPRWKQVLTAADADTVYLTRRDAPIRQVALFLDESEIELDTGERVFMLGLTITEDRSYVEGQLRELLNELVSDSFIPGRRSKLKKHGLHWVDLAEDVRAKVVAIISRLPLRAYVFYRRFAPGETLDFVTEYEKLFDELMRGRFVSLDGADVEIVFENHSKLKAATLQKRSNSIYEESKRRNGRAPRQPPTVRQGSKLGEPCLATSDILMGAFGDYATKSSPAESPVTSYTSRFERVRHRIRMIVELRSLGRKIVYTARRPFAPWKT